MHSTFFINGHECRIECMGRARYVGYIDDEEVIAGSSFGACKTEVKTEARYMVETEPDFVTACKSVHDFVDSKVPGRNGENEYVQLSAVREEVTPDNNMLAHEAMLALEQDGFIETTKAYSSPNFEWLLRPTGDEPEDLSSAEPLFNL